MLALCNGAAVELAVDGGATVLVQAGQPLMVNGAREERMRVGCGSATVGMFAKQWQGRVDEVVVDDHITGVLSEHQVGKLLGIPGHRRPREEPPVHAGPLFPGGAAGHGLGRHRHRGPAGDPRPLRSEGGAAGPYGADDLHHRGAPRLFRAGRGAAPVEQEMPPALRASVVLIRENCEPALATVLFMGGGGSLRFGGTENPVRLTRSVKDALTTVTCGGTPVSVWPGGITFMVDVSRVPGGAFGSVPTPRAGGAGGVHPAAVGLRGAGRAHGSSAALAQPADGGSAPGGATGRQPLAAGPAAVRTPPQARLWPDGRLHLQHGPIDLILGASAELPALRAEAGPDAPALRGPVARRSCGRRTRSAALPPAAGAGAASPSASPTR